jgi:hypothetical protein
MTANLQRRLTVDQRLLLADCVRSALVGWMITCPQAGQISRRIQYQSTTASGFSFSRFCHHATKAFGDGFQPLCPGTNRPFPLSIGEAAALANDMELELATDDEIHAAGLIAAHGAFGQPEVCSPSWRVYVGAMSAVGIAWLDGDPTWKQRVRDRLKPFRRHVAAAPTLTAAE